VRDELHTEHVARDIASFVGASGKFYATAFAAPTGMNLGLDYNDLTA
jgi:hypothetical protein